MELRADFLRDLSQRPIVAADNICEFLYAENPKEVWEYGCDFPSCMPPFEQFFVDCSRPSRILSEGKIKSALSLPEKWGWMFTAVSREKVQARFSEGENHAKVTASIARQLKEVFPLVDTAAILRAKEHSDPKDGYAILGNYEKTYLSLGAQYMKLRDGSPLTLPNELHTFLHCELIFCAYDRVALPGLCDIAITKDGAILNQPVFSTAFAGKLQKGEHIELRDTWSALMLPALLAISFMNCKNVTTTTIEPDKAINRQRTKAHLEPFLRYQTINIEPMKKVLRTEGKSETGGLIRALHICRGHFAHYSEEKPLFGKVAGTFWIPSHTRGSSEAGMIVSDYNVQGPPR